MAVRVERTGMAPLAPRGRGAHNTVMDSHERRPDEQPHARSIHPGAGRRKAREVPKGRQTDPAALAEVQALLGDRPRRTDLLIEHLHLLQDRHRCLHARHLAALAHEMRLALVEVYEVASFYAHFDIVMEDEAAPPPITVRVCDSLTCELMGARSLLCDLPAALGSSVRVVRAPCMGGCHNAPVTAISHSLHERATVESVARTVANGETQPRLSSYPDLQRYRAEGGYTLLAKCLDGERAVEDIIKTLEASDLRGLGGAGFPAGRKWRFVRAEPAPRLRRSTPTRESPAPSRTGTTSKPTPIASSKAC